MMICITDWVENIVGKGENAGNQHFLLFPQCFQKASFSEVVENRDCVVTKELPLSQTSPGFYVWGRSLLKTPWEKEKLLVTSNLFFSHSVFYPFAVLSALFIKFEIVVCKLYILEESRICHLGKG